MSWNLTDVALDESHGVLIELVNSINSQTTFEPEELEFQAEGVTFSYEQTTGTAPDPVVTTRYVMHVPWSNIRAIRQAWAV